jgi:hypothetical protein
MMRALWGCVLPAMPLVSLAMPWDFTPPVDVAEAKPGVFHQLDSSGRQHLAFAGTTLALTWADNRSGASQVYAAFTATAKTTFRDARQLSDGRDATEPVVLALGSDGFLFAWTQDGAVWLRAVRAQRWGSALKLAQHGAQASLAALDGERALVAWREQRDGRGQIRLTSVRLEAGAKIVPSATAPVMVEGSPADQSYPVVAWSGERGVVVWEDRRRGHNVLFMRRFDRTLKFLESTILNDQPLSAVTQPGKGIGVMRAVLRPFGRGGIVAVWLDKRTLAVGYDVYGALWAPGAPGFGPNEKVQDDFGDKITQWHATVAANAKGAIVAAWDDDRDETSDLWLTWRGASGWAENQAVPVASGTGEQTAPALWLDEAGRLHLLWIDRASPEAPTRLRYSRGTPVNTKDFPAQ